jgi:hypothetical protein
VSYCGDWVAVHSAILGSKCQGTGAESYGNIVEFHPGDAEYDRVVAEFGYEHGYSFMVVKN